MPIDHGLLALVGSGEYLPSMQEVERSLLVGRPPRYVQLATAAAREGDESLARWHALGAEQAASLGVEQVVIDVRTRADANDQTNADLIADAGLIYLSGGDPGHLASTLVGTEVWAAIVRAWVAGASLAGCSAGAMAMAATVPSLRHPIRGEVGGLALLPHLRVLPHFDRMAGWMPDAITRFVLHGTDGVALLGIDEETAMVGGPYEWTVRGARSVWLLKGEGRTEFSAGTTFLTPGLAAEQ